MKGANKPIEHFQGLQMFSRNADATRNDNGSLCHHRITMMLCFTMRRMCNNAH